MGKSHQAGWVVLRGKRWYGYFRKRVLNPITNEQEARSICIPLDLKSKMTKSEARDALTAEVTKQTGQNLLGARVLKDSSVTFEWFVRDRYFTLRKGDWRPETAKEKMAQIEIDLIAKFGEYPLDSFDRFMLQTHVNELAEQYSQDRVKQARSYLKSIFDEAIEQEFLIKDPTRKLKIPKNLRPKDKQVLSWEQLWLVLAKTARRDRLLLMLDMTDALRPSELFALRWRSLMTQHAVVDRNGSTGGSSAPSGKPPEASPKFIFRTVWQMSSGTGRSSVRRPPARKAPRTPSSSRTRMAASWIPTIIVTGSSNTRGEAWPSQAELSDPAANHGDPGAKHGFGKGHPGTPAAFAGRHDGQRIYAGAP